MYFGYRDKQSLRGTAGNLKRFKNDHTAAIRHTFTMMFQKEGRDHELFRSNISMLISGSLPWGWGVEFTFFVLEAGSKPPSSIPMRLGQPTYFVKHDANGYRQGC